MRKMLEKSEPKMYQDQIAGVSEHRVKTSQLQEKEQDLTETEAALYEKFSEYWKRGGQETRPEWIIYENVKGMLSSNRGLDFLSIIVEMERLGYDIQWQNINSKNHGVPQNRERIYTIGRLRRKGRCEIFPIGCSCKVTNELQRQAVNTLTTRNGASTTVGSYIIEGQQHAQVKQIIGGSQGSRVYDSNGFSCTLSSQGGGQGAKTGLYAVPVLTPERAKKRQNGRRFKEEGEPMFMLTAQDRHGVLTDKAIRRLTPKECFRLQGWTDDYFEKAEFVNSDNQSYKQAGNGVTVNVVHEIAKKMRIEHEK